jgi:hypothetical protein
LPNKFPNASTAYQDAFDTKVASELSGFLFAEMWVVVDDDDDDDDDDDGVLVFPYGDGLIVVVVVVVTKAADDERISDAAMMSNARTFFMVLVCKYRAETSLPRALLAIT